MKEFFLNDKKFLAYYIGLWLITTTGLFLVLKKTLSWDYLPLLADTLISTVLFFFIFLSLWYVVRFAGGYSVQMPDKLLSTFIAAGVLVAIWAYLSSQALILSSSEWPGYGQFVLDTLWIRALMGAVLAVIVNLLFYNFYLISFNRQAAERESQLKELVQRTELQALKNQLNPHFIYNSLNSISSLTITTPEKAREMIIRLSDFLRYALKQDAMQMTSLEKELENIEYYLQIEKVRFGEKLRYRLEINPLLKNLALPVMILQPLFENAVKHGVQKSSEPSEIRFVAAIRDQEVTLLISNVFDSKFDRFRSEGVGLENIRNRLRLIYGNGKLLSVKADEGVFTASLTLPKTEYHEEV